MNNVFKFEAKRGFKAFIIYNVCLILVTLLYLSIYPAFASATEAFTKVIASLPEVLSEGLNFNISILESALGFYTFTISYVYILFGIYIAYTGIKLFSYETTKKIEDYIYTKPMARSKLFIAKYLFGMIVMIMTLIVYTIAAFIMINFYSDEALDPDAFMRIQLSLFFFIFTIYNISILIGIVFKKIKFISSYATSLIFGFFFLSFLSTLIDYNWAKFISPFSTFNSALFANNDDVFEALIYTIIIFIICIIVSSHRFMRRDS